MARMMKNAKNSNHGRLLRQREKALSDRQSGTDSYDPRERLEVAGFHNRDRKI